MDIEILSRLQFAFTIAFHYIYPPLSIGLGVALVVFEGMYLRTGDRHWEQLTKFWIKVFALIFGIGVATGIVMEFEFGTNWAAYSRYVGDIFGSALAAEGVFAFALESTFLGVLLFGWNKVSPKVHFFSTIMVTLGSMFSAIWIVVANSWQQTPAGFKIVGEGPDAKAEITDFWAMVFNPSSVDRIIHVWIGAFLAGTFLVLSVHAYYILKNRFVEQSKKAFGIILVIAAISALSQLLTGHTSASGVAENQPAKLAAFEGHYDSLAVADMYLFGWVNQTEQTVTGIKIPKGLTFLIHQDLSTPVKGLNAFNENERPAMVNFIFQTYHLMISIGMLMIGLTLFSLFLWRKGRLFNKRWLMIIFSFSVVLPQIVNQVGWYSAEVGRQPWVVYNLLRTSDALSENVKSEQVIFSLILFTIVYLILFSLFIYLLNKKIQAGLDLAAPEKEYPRKPLITS
jgi:cytochrome d ubiquinol oxidase subunit I